MPDDWTLDDWDEEAFDEDVWDITQDEPDESADGGWDEEEDEEDWAVTAGGFGFEEDDAVDEYVTKSSVGGGSGTRPDSGTSAAGAGRIGASSRGGGMSWSAWDVGTIFALGGWLADRHSEQVSEQLRATIAEHGSAQPTPPATPSATGRPKQAPHPAPPTRYPYRRSHETLQDGGPLHQGILFSELDAAGRAGHDLLVQAEGRESGQPLVLLVSVVPAAAGPRLWVVAEERPGGFSATRLVPVFQPDRNGGVAVFATDVPLEAVDAAVWACRREGVELDSLVVTIRR